MLQARKLMYSAETNHLLNLLTLQIHDPEIAREYQLFQTQRFLWILKLMSLGYLLRYAIHLGQYWAGSIDVGELIEPLYFVLNLAVLMLPILLCRRHTPKFWVLSQIPALVIG